jgi:hypothetical protein
MCRCQTLTPDPSPTRRREQTSRTAFHTVFLSTRNTVSDTSFTSPLVGEGGSAGAG